MFAVLEMKNTYAINEAEFAQACFDRENVKDALARLAQNSVAPSNLPGLERGCDHRTGKELRKWQGNSA